jgi:hypothetical protein
MFALALLAIGATAASAQEVAEHLARCQDEKGTAAARISACTRVITQADNDDLKLEGYIQRGVLHEVNGEAVAAVNDYSEAIKLDPNNALAYFNRGQRQRPARQGRSCHRRLHAGDQDRSQRP